MFCEFCGASLIGQKPLDTKSLGSTEDAVKEEYGVDADALTDVRVQGTPTFEEGDRLRLEIEGCPDPLFFEIEKEAVFGRKDPATGAMPDIDLTPFAGYRMGVSRRHAAISRNAENGLDVRDLGSSNGTFLNGQQLTAHRLYALRNGDELRLGQMVIRVLFEPAQAPHSAEAADAAAPQSEEETPAKTLTAQRPKELAAEGDAAKAEDAKPAAAASEAQQEAQAEVSGKKPPTDAAEAPSAAQPAATASEPEPTGQASEPAQPAASGTETRAEAEKPPQSPPDAPKAADKDERD